MLSIILGITTTLLVCLTWLPKWPSDHWIARVWEFPRLQISLLLAVNGTACFILPLNWLTILLVVSNLICLMYQCYWIYPYTKFHPTEVKCFNSDSNAPTIKILTSNVLMTNRSADKLIALVDLYKPDILVTLESNQWWQDALQALSKDYPHSINVPLENLYGMHVFSRLELSNINVRYIIEAGVPSIHCDVDIGDGTMVKCHFIHPAPPSPTENETATPRDKELMLIANQVEPERFPTIVTGDLNDVAWSPTTLAFKKVSGLNDPRIGRGFFNTFHATYPFARWPLDHIFHSDHFDIKDIRRLPSIDSDHFPLLSELGINHSHQSSNYNSSN